MDVGGDIVLMTDHGSGEGSQPLLEAAIEILTGIRPVSIDARHFMTGGNGRATAQKGTLRLDVPSEDLVATPDVLVIYEIPPAERRRFETFQRMLLNSRSTCLGADVDAWRAATDKHRTVARFLREGIPHMETIALCCPDPDSALDAFERLGRNVWARPRTGAGGKDVFHVTTIEHLHDARRHYAASDQDWLVSRDARNMDPNGRRHQFRVVVLHDQVLSVRTCAGRPGRALQRVPGCRIHRRSHRRLPARILPLAVSATRSLGLPFGGVDLTIENGGVVFEVNVHPVLDVSGGLETLAIPFVQAHLPPR